MDTRTHLFDAVVQDGEASRHVHDALVVLDVVCRTTKHVNKGEREADTDTLTVTGLQRVRALAVVVGGGALGPALALSRRPGPCGPDGAGAAAAVRSVVARVAAGAGLALGDQTQTLVLAVVALAATTQVALLVVRSGHRRRTARDHPEQAATCQHWKHTAIRVRFAGLHSERARVGADPGGARALLGLVRVAV